ncbi:rare lipoprotein A [Roseibium hamelinense]|uniref:Endolytic peptidoglycan transglycosylase RlpA n=1 Tax=Roseibium hamelinense TaxID=150831 RepID=A0A562TJ49_9HYPH|nr:septal ring lytic transglycosylase RlpA family protein [Roseibium hamelinense]MTI45832.1 septal ring lytic transglycosylase RlpA family protein [Roseibium hamelinense]TWI92986.1 rare lipoprotein A [Roseibium hamelinense]
MGQNKSGSGHFKQYWAPLRTGLLVAAAAGVLAACSATPETPKAKFSPKKYGVKGSPKVVAAGQPVPKGGGRYVVGKKYKIAGKWYYPKHDPNYRNVGLASWYGPTFHGRKTANGEVFDRNGLTAAHTTMPLPSYARVTNVSNGRSMIVRVNDRGPFHGNRIIDLSERVATMLGTKDQGIGKVKVEYIGKARLDGQDEKYLMASYSGPDAVQPGGTFPGTQLAQAVPPQLIFGGAPAPAPRPYNSQPAIAYAGQTQVAQAAFDPAIAFEASRGTVQVASLNTFAGGLTGDEVVTPTSATPVPVPAFSEPRPAPAAGTLGVLRVPAPAEPQSFEAGSAVSSYMANGRVAAAHDVFGTVSGGSISLAELAKRR